MSFAAVASFYEVYVRWVFCWVSDYLDSLWLGGLLDVKLKEALVKNNKKQDLSLLSGVKWNYKSLSIIGALLVVSLYSAAESARGLDGLGPGFAALIMAPIFLTGVLVLGYKELKVKLAKGKSLFPKGSKTSLQSILKTIVVTISIAILFVATVNSAGLLLFMDF